MAADKWNPGQYEHFKAERAQPFHDLLALVETGEGAGGGPRRAAQRERAAAAAFRAVDLGCGTGELTALLHARLRAADGASAETLGLDSSAAMLGRSGDFARDGLSFRQGDIADFVANHEGRAEFDLLFSNAALQWLPEHWALFPRLLSCARPGGQFAAQMPCNQDHPAYAVAAEAASEPQFAAALGGHERRTPVLAPEDYALLLARAGCAAQTVRLNVYLHRLPDRAALVEWLKGSLLTDYEKRLAPELFDAFLARYRELLYDRVPDEQPCLFTFKRVLLWARLPG